MADTDGDDLYSDLYASTATTTTTTAPGKRAAGGEGGGPTTSGKAEATSNFRNGSAHETTEREAGDDAREAADFAAAMGQGDASGTSLASTTAPATTTGPSTQTPATGGYSFGGIANSYQQQVQAPQSYGGGYQHTSHSSAHDGAGKVLAGGGMTDSERIRNSADLPEEGKMFVGGLNWDTTDEGMKNYFSQFGKVLSSVIMRDPNTGRSRGFGFLTFEEPKAVNTVMVREHYLDGKIIDPKRAIPRPDQQKVQKVFIGGLPATIDSERFQDFFVQFGKVMDSTLMMDRDTGRPRGFGFVTFEDESSVERLLSRGLLEIDGKPIEVKRATPKGGRRGEEEMSGGPSMGAGPGAGSRYGAAPQANNNRFGGGAAMPGAGAPMNGGMGAFDPSAMAAMYQRMVSMGMMPGFPGMGMGGMGMGMGMGGMGNMGAMGGGGMNPMSMRPMSGMSPNTMGGAANPMGAGGFNNGMANPMQQRFPAQQRGMGQSGSGANYGGSGNNHPNNPTSNSSLPPPAQGNDPRLRGGSDASTGASRTSGSMRGQSNYRPY